MSEFKTFLLRNKGFMVAAVAAALAACAIVILIWPELFGEKANSAALMYAMLALLGSEISDSMKYKGVFLDMARFLSIIGLTLANGMALFS